jgi:hypothetical protein
MVLYFRYSYYLLFILFLTSFSETESGHRKDIIRIIDEKIPRAEKEAIVILSGFGTKLEGIKDIRDYFSGKGYDLFIPHYIGRDSIGECVSNWDTFFNRHYLSEYKKVHVFSYIVGSWTLNKWLKKNSRPNIRSIIYNRSPLQERAPYALVNDSPLLIRMLSGRIMREFANTPYPSVPNDSTNIAIIMESRATPLIRKHKKTALSLGEIDWSIASRKQDCDDYLFTLNNHDDMYHDFSVIGPEIFQFIRTGKFTEKAQRTKPEIDPFTGKK